MICIFTFRCVNACVSSKYLAFKYMSNRLCHSVYNAGKRTVLSHEQVNLGRMRRHRKGGKLMRKTHYRDYATEAFRLLAREGSAALYRQKVYNTALARRGEAGSGIGSPTEAAVIRAEQAVYEAEATIRDLEAAEAAVNVLECKYGVAAVKALKRVYMAEADRDIKRGEISERVNKAIMNIPASEESIYRWLRFARTSFAKNRGLRI